MGTIEESRSKRTDKQEDECKVERVWLRFGGRSGWGVGNSGERQGLKAQERHRGKEARERSMY